VSTIVALRGGRNLRRMRSDAAWIVAEARPTDNDGTARREIVREAIDPNEAATHSLAPLRAFCREPLPTFRTASERGGFILGKLAGNHVGNASAITCITADVIRNAASCYQDEHNPHGELVACVLVHDLLVLERLFGPIAPEVVVHDDYWRKMSHRDTVPDAVALVIREEVAWVGRRPAARPTPGVPH
jgi:hypothetical protein